MSDRQVTNRPTAWKRNGISSSHRILEGPKGHHRAHNSNNEVFLGWLIDVWLPAGAEIVSSSCTQREAGGHRILV